MERKSVVSENHTAQNTNETKSHELYAAKDTNSYRRKEASLNNPSYIPKRIILLF